MVHILDRAYDDKGFTKSDRAKIKHILTELAGQLIVDHGKDELKDLYNKHSGDDIDAAQEEADAMAAELMKSMMGSMFGIEVGDEVDLFSPEKMQAFLHEKMQEAEAQQRQAEEKRAKRKKNEETARKGSKKAAGRAKHQSINSRSVPQAGSCWNLGSKPSRSISNI